MGFVSSIMGFFGFGFGITAGLVIGYYLFIYFQPSDVKDIRRELKLEPFVVLETVQVDEEVQRAIVNEACPQCHHPEFEYYTKQLRSADEGQTVFYECRKCGHKYSVNT